MKQLFVFSIICLVFIGNGMLYAQPKTTTVEDDTYGKGGTKVTTVEDDGLGTKTTTEEFYNNEKPPKLREKIIRIKNQIEGDSTVKSYDFNTKGDTTAAREKVFRKNPDGSYKIIYSHTIHYKHGNPNEGYRSIHLPDGRIEESKFNNKTGGFDVEKKVGIEVLPGFRQQKEKSLSLSGGYSYLQTNSNGHSDSYPLGGFLTLAYYLNIRMALLGDFSLHSRKDLEFQTTLAFLMGGLQYNLLRERQKKLMLYARALLGLALDKQKYGGSSTNSASSFAIAGGLGFFVPITDRIAINVIADYIRTTFGDDSQNNIRAGAGIKVRLGK